ncbi:MAG: hypothetical protein JNM38_13205 [Acidobacteria bacterium]|nr:hypothetical protein [Acidobacteriota bacterium]
MSRRGGVVEAVMLALAGVIAAQGCVTVASTSGSPGGAPAKRVERILFIGNSLTFANDLPRMVRDVVEHGTNMTVEYDAVAFPDFSLEDHWNDGRARRALQSGQWTLVVMQQGPSASAEGRQVLREYATKFAELGKHRGARSALYTVWPSRSRLGDIDAVIESHRLAAQDAGAGIVPVGVAWRGALREDPSLPLYADDGFHPSRVGTYLAALVFREWLTGEPPGGFTRTWRRPPPLAPPVASLLEDAAHLAVRDAVLATGGSPIPR